MTGFLQLFRDLNILEVIMHNFLGTNTIYPARITIEILWICDYYDKLLLAIQPDTIICRFGVWFIVNFKREADFPRQELAIYTVPRVPVPNAVKTALFLRINEFYRPCRRTRSNGCLGFLEPPTSTFSFLTFILPRIHTIQVNLLP